MTRRVDQPALSQALEELKGLAFPGHPNDSELAEWVLDLAELDGHVVGLAVSALASGRSDLARSSECARHEARFTRLGVAESDEAIYHSGRLYVRRLQCIENLLAGRIADLCQ